MEAFKLILIIVHVLAGVIVLLLGAAVMILPKKGNQRHRVLGKIYFWSMMTIVGAGMLLMIFFLFNLFLFSISIFSAYLVFVGYRSPKIKRPGTEKPIDWAAAIITLVSGIGLGLFGLYNLVFESNLMDLGILSLIFAFFLIHTSLGGLRSLKRKQRGEKMQWLYDHMNGMIGAYIAAFTAFIVQNGESFAPNFEHNWIFWLLPAMLGLPLTGLWVKKYKRTHP